MSAARQRRIQKLLERAQRELEKKRLQLASATRAELQALDKELRAADSIREAAALARERLSVDAEAVEWVREAVWQSHLGGVHDSAVELRAVAEHDVVLARDAVRACLRRSEMFDALLTRLDRAQQQEANREERRVDDEWASQRAHGALAHRADPPLSA
jgi:hypothetical protein